MFLIVFTPLAFGTVHAWAYTIMELVICLLVIIVIIRLIITNIKKLSTSQGSQSSTDNSKPPVFHSTSSMNLFGLAKTPLNIPIILFIGLIILQLIPLPPGFLKSFSPNTYDVYKKTLPGWPGEVPFSKHLPSNPEPSLSPESKSSNHVPEGPDDKPSILKTRFFHHNRMPFSIYPYATIMEYFKILAYIGIFFIITNTPFLRINRIIIIIVSVGFFISLLGILQDLSGTKNIYWFRDASYSVKIFGPYVNRNHFAGYICMVIPLAIGLLISRFTNTFSSRGTKQRLIVTAFQSHFFHNLLLFFAIIIMISALFLSTSRGGVLSFAVSITALFTIAVFCGLFSNTVKGLGITFAVIIIAFVLLAWIGLNPILDRLSFLGFTTRSIVYHDTVNMIKDFPLIGTGLGTFQYLYPKYKTLNSQSYSEYVHNDYLEILSDTGIFGFLIVITGIILFFWKVVSRWRKRRDPYVKGITLGGFCSIIAILSHSFVDFNLHIPANALLLSIILGLVWNTVNLKRVNSKDNKMVKISLSRSPS